MLVGEDRQTMTSTGASRLEHISPVFVLHSLAKAMNPQTAAVLRLKGSFHFRLLLLRIQNTARVRRNPGFLRTKGTAPRRADPAADAAEIDTLRTDPKQRAENLMIVDLLRNDLSQVCEPGSVSVPDLFRVESYPTVHQMTSTVTGILPQNSDVMDVITALVPCGSITGAPKIRAMQVIAEVESEPRNI